jgi:aspartate/methionine/tyrosine aminotransferase
MFERALADPTLINLAVGQPDFDTPAHIVAAAKRALDDGYTRYAPGLGYPTLREAIAVKVSRQNGFSVDPEHEVIVTVGAMEGIMLALLAVIDPGDEVLVPDPGYTNYPGQVLMAGGVPVRVPVRETNGFSLSPADVQGALTPRTRALILNTPGNPTGGLASEPDLGGLADICRRHGLIVIADEVYEAMTYDGARHVSIASLPGMKEHSVTVMSFSKTYAMTGWRVGYAVGSAEIIQQMHKLQENMVSSVNSVAQMAALAALQGPQDCVRAMVDAYDQRRRFLVDGLNAIPGIHCRAPLGAFYAFPNVTALGRPVEELAVWLADRGKVATVPGTAFGPGGEGYLRLCYAASQNELEQALERIDRAVRDL